MHPTRSASSNSPSADSDLMDANAVPGTDSPIDAGIEDAVDLLQRLFRGFDGTLSVRLWNGATFRFGRPMLDRASPGFTLVCRSPAAICSAAGGHDRLRLAQAFFTGEIDIEGDFYAALQLKDQLDEIRLSWRDRLGALLPALRLKILSLAHSGPSSADASRNSTWLNGHSRDDSRAAVRFHYDVSNDFYALWLDPAMVYSCAYFEQPEDSLAQAQHAKLDHICRKLQLQPTDHLLDIGCGWGALLVHAAREYGVRAHGVTLSQRQFEFATHQIARAGLSDRVTVALQDYRDLPGISVYDKIASVGMFEHVGLKNLPVYFSTVQRLLKPSGLFLNHGITHYVEGWDKRTLSTEFINRYIFPAGELDTVGNILRAMERAGFEIADVEALRRHYALTLRHWVARLEQHHEKALEHVSESTYRAWRLYMAACALEFESGDIGVHQLLASKRVGGVAALPLTRRHLYPLPAQNS